MTIGPAVGGLLAQPTKRFPSIFPSGGFFSRFPYLLPNLVGVLFAIVCIFLTIFFVPETKIGWGIDRYFELRQQKRTRKPGVSGDYGEVDSGESRKDTSGDLPSVWYSGKFMSPAHHRSLTSPAQPRSCVSPAHARLPVSSACEEIRMRRPDSLDAVSEPDDGPSTSTQGEPPVTPGHAPPAIVGDGGGLFKIPYVISGVLATGLIEVFFVAGIVHTVYMFSAYNWITKRPGVETTHRIAGIMAVVISAAVPFIGYFAWSGTATFIVSCVLVTLVNSTSYMLYNIALMASANTAPPALRGKVAGLTSASMGIGGALGPFTFSLIFAWSISPVSSANESSLVNQHFAFNVAAVLRVLVLILLWRVLGGDTLTEVAVEDSSNMELPSMELKTNCEDDMPEYAGNSDDRQANLV